MQIKKKLLDLVRDAMTQSYIGLVKQYIFFHNKKHPIEIDKNEIE